MVASACGAVSPKAMRQRILMFSTYILKSIAKDWYYIGHTANIEERLRQHNNGQSRATKPYKPFALIYKEDFDTKGEAFTREQQIKRYKHGDAFKKLIK